MLVLGLDDHAGRAFARHQPVAVIERGVERQIDAIGTLILARRAIADILALEADRLRAARGERVGPGQCGYLSVGFAVNVRENRRADLATVTSASTFGNRKRGGM